MADGQTIRKSRRLAKKQKERAKAKDKKAARASIGDALGVRSQAKAANLAEANALARAEAAAADLERKTPGKRGKKEHRTPKVSRSSRIMRAKVAATFDSDVDDEDDYDNRSMPPLTSDEDVSDDGGFADEPEYEEKAENEGAAAAEAVAEPDERDVEVDPVNGEINTPGPSPKPTKSDDDFIRRDGSDVSYEPSESEDSEDDDMSEESEYKRRLALAARRSREEVADPQEEKPGASDEDEDDEEADVPPKRPKKSKKKRKKQKGGRVSSKRNSRPKQSRKRESKKKLRKRKKREKRRLAEERRKEQERKLKQRLKRLKKKRKKEKKRKRRRRPSSSDSSSDSSDSSSDSDSCPDLTEQSESSSDTEESSDDSSSESEDEGYEGYRRIRRQEYAPRRTAVVYNGDDLKGLNSPVLKYGDKAARKAFRVTYLTYVAEHENRMRSRMPEDRVLPRAVVECVEPNLLVYICKYELDEEYQTDDPAKVSALAIHRWVMACEKGELEMEDSEGIKKLKGLKLEITGEGGVRGVQTLFMTVDKTRKHYRLNTTEEQIIKWLTWNIQPTKVRDNVKSYLGQASKKAKRAGKRLREFHALLMSIAKTFQASYELGLETKPRKKPSGKEGGSTRSKNKNKGNKGNANPNTSPSQSRSQSPKGEGRRNKEGKLIDKKGRVVKCINCEGNHYVTQCPKVPASRKDWTFEQHLKAKNEAEGSSRSSGHPGGKPKKKLKSETAEASENPRSDPGGEKPKKRLASKASDSEDSLGPFADGTAKVGGVGGFYSCDGGCDKATIGNVYADALARQGHEVVRYETPLKATLCDGSEQDAIIGYVVADIELKTPAGKVILERTHVDVLQGPEREFILYIGKREEARLNLKSYATQLEEAAARAEADLVIPPEEEPGEDQAGDNNRTTKVSKDGKPVEQVFNPAQQPRFKKRLARQEKSASSDPKVQGDGQAFVGDSGWAGMREVKYLREPAAEETYVTSAALGEKDGTVVVEQSKVRVAAYDLDLPVQKWMGADKARYSKRVEIDLRVLPDENKDLIQRLTILPKTTVRIVDSQVPAVVIGKDDMQRLAERGAEQLDAGHQEANDDPGIDLRLQEQLEGAKLAGMTRKGLRRAEKMIRKRFRGIWRIKLGPTDFADVPALEIKLKPGKKFQLPKPYMRRYSAKEVKWWRENIEKLVECRIFRPSESSNLSPSNLVKKLLDGRVLTDDFRLVIDLRELNKIIEDLHFPLPKLDEVVHHLRGATCFSKSDETKGYWQFMLSELSRALTGFICPIGAFEHLRVPMGLKTAAAYFQKIMQLILKPLLYNGLIQYLDDSLLYGGSEEELLDRLEQFFTLLEKHNVKLHPGKFVLFARELVWGGKRVSPTGVSPAPHRIASIRDMPDPDTLAEMMNFVYGTAWFRGHILHFCEIAAPLYDIYKEAMTKFKRKTTQNAMKIKLADIPAWETKGKAAFENVKRAMTESLETTYFDPELVTCVFGDASENFWCLVITQCRKEDLKLPWDQQVGKHRLLAIETGRFRHAQRRWHIVEKEAFVFGVKAIRFTHWINGGRYPARFYTDHKNLLALFSDKARPLSCTRPNRDRLTRWGITLLCLWYEIYHIDGCENRLADLGSRWGNRFVSENQEGKAEDAAVPKKHLTTGLAGGPKPMMQMLTRRAGDDARFKRVLRTAPPAVGDDISKPDQDMKKFLVLPEENLLLNRKPVAKAQRKHSKKRPKGLRRDDGAPKLWVDSQERVWIPRAEKQLQKQCYALAHQGISGHRGKEATLKILRTYVFWDGMEDDVEAWRATCLHCLKLASGTIVPRPLGSQLVAQRPGEILMFDYIKMGNSRSGYAYVLMLVDRFTRRVMFFPAVAATAIIAARAIITWSAQFGLPEWWISDGGSHFKNEVLRELAECLGVEHHITLAYCPWANGGVEVVGKDLLWTCRALLSEFRSAVDEWDLVLPVVEFIVNHRPRDVLGGRSAIEVSTGRRPKNALELVLWKGLKIKGATKMKTTTARVDEFCNKLVKSLGRLHEEIANEAERKQRKKTARQARNPGIRFCEGDLVMVSAVKNAANVQRHSKLMVLWQGPYQVVDVVSPTTLNVQNVGGGKVVPVSWRKCKRLGGPELKVSDAVKTAAIHDLQKFLVEDLLAWKGKKGAVKLQVKWRGYEEVTWEPLENLYEDVPYLVRKYVEGVNSAALTAALKACENANDKN